jgi:hypothetical protein
MQILKAIVIVALTGAATLSVRAQAQPASPEQQNRAIELLRRTLGQENQQLPPRAEPAPRPAPARTQPAPRPIPGMSPAPAIAPPISDKQHQALELLRREIDEQRASRPDIRSPRAPEPPPRRAPAPSAPAVRSRGQAAPAAPHTVQPAPAPVQPPELEPAPAGARTRQQQLAELIELYRADKITSAEYHARRAQILAQPAE